MTDKNEQKIASILRRVLSRSRSAVTPADCPDEETLANYLGGGFDASVRESLESHLANCSFCTDILVAAYKTAEQPITETVPQWLFDRAKDLVPQNRHQPGVLDLVVRLVKDSLELVSTSGQWITPLTAAPMGVRGRPQPSETTILQVEKELGRFKVGIEVERIEANLCQVAVRIVGQDGKPADDMRVSLILGSREQASYLTRQGEAIFDRIPKGEYHLAISDSGTPVGTIRLELMA